MTYTDPTGYFSLGSIGAAMNTSMSLGLRGYNAYSNVSLLMDIASGDVTATELVLTFAAAKFLPRAFFKCKNSFVAGTLVHAEGGLMPIERVKLGDKVWSFNEVTGEKSLQEVIHLVDGSGDKELVDILLSSGDLITATSNHPFYVPNVLSWIDAGILADDSFLYGFFGSEISIQSIEQYSQTETVYNLSIANNHNYFVSDEGVLAHNCYQKPKSIDYGKHVPRKKWTRKETIDATKNGDSMYFMKGTHNIQKFELEAWKIGKPTTNGKPWKVAEFPEEIGAHEGKAVRWLRLEYSKGGDVIHGHPISYEKYRKLLK